MAYSPSLQDIDKPSGGYMPSLNDIAESNDRPKTSDTFLGELPYPTRDQLTSISKDDIQKGAGMLMPFVAPEIKALPYVSKLLTKIPLGIGTGIGNALGRIGYGTALTTAPDLFTKNGRDNLPDELGSNLQGNAMLEALSWPLGRAANSLAELFNPIKYSRNKAQQIKNEHDASKAVMEQNYRPINEKYGDFNISVKPEDYLKKAGINKELLYPDAQKAYDDFKNEPSYKNLLGLKSQIGRDWAKISQTDKVYDSQLFNRYRNSLDGKLRSFLSRDENALNQYNLANNYAENVFYPYLSTPTLRTISKGKFNVIYPDKMAKSIEKATHRTVGAEQKNVVPLGHPLRNHLKDLQNRIAAGDISEMTIPPIAGAITGSMFHPSGVGIGSGAVTGYGLGALASKLKEYPVVQTPLIQNAFRKATPFYYKGGRALIGSDNENQ